MNWPISWENLYSYVAINKQQFARHTSLSFSAYRLFGWMPLISGKVLHSIKVGFLQNNLMHRLHWVCFYFYTVQIVTSWNLVHFSVSRPWAAVVTKTFYAKPFFVFIYCIHLFKHNNFLYKRENRRRLLILKHTIKYSNAVLHKCKTHHGPLLWYIQFWQLRFMEMAVYKKCVSPSKILLIQLIKRHKPREWFFFWFAVEVIIYYLEKMVAGA